MTHWIKSRRIWTTLLRKCQLYRRKLEGVFLKEQKPCLYSSLRVESRFCRSQIDLDTEAVEVSVLKLKASGSLPERAEALSLKLSS
jgi:hypothetical protein